MTPTCVRADSYATDFSAMSLTGQSVYSDLTCTCVCTTCVCTWVCVCTACVCVCVYMGVYRGDREEDRQTGRQTVCGAAAYISTDCSGIYYC